MTKTALAVRIQELRKKCGWSQETLEEKAGFKKGYVSLIESGKRRPKIDKLDTLAKLFGVTVSELSGKEVLQGYPDAYTPKQRELIRLVPTDLLPAYVDFTREWVMQPEDDRALVVEFQKILRFHRTVHSKSKRPKPAPVVADSREVIMGRIRKAVAELPPDVRPNIEKVVDVVMGMGPEAQAAYLDFVRVFMAERRSRPLPEIVSRSDGELQEVAGGQQNRV